jgi:hypothetical protein
VRGGVAEREEGRRSDHKQPTHNTTAARRGGLHIAHTHCAHSTPRTSGSACALASAEHDDGCVCSPSPSPFARPASGAVLKADPHAARARSAPAPLLNRPSRSIAIVHRAAVARRALRPQRPRKWAMSADRGARRLRARSPRPRRTSRVCQLLLASAVFHSCRLARARAGDVATPFCGLSASKRAPPPKK